jgi:hypothetical protein
MSLIIRPCHPPQTEYEEWEDLPGGHLLKWKPIGYPVQEFRCHEGWMVSSDLEYETDRRCDKCGDDS